MVNDSEAGAMAGWTSNSPPQLGSYRSLSTTHSQPDAFHITVAVRIRPFRAQEIALHHRALESQRVGHGKASALEVVRRLQQTRRSERQPFGPRYTNRLADAQGRNNNNNSHTGNGGDDVEQMMSTVEVQDEISSLVPIVDVEADGKTLVLLDPTPSETARGVFVFDHVFASCAAQCESTQADEAMLYAAAATHSGDYLSDEHDDRDTVAENTARRRCSAQAESEQVRLYHALGLPLVDNLLSGYHGCLFAYGQTSSGKTYTMLGTRQHAGLIPRICHELFRRVEQEEEQQQDGESMSYGVEGGQPRVEVLVSYLEIYNETLRDLLKQRPKNAIIRYENRFDKREVDYAEYHGLRVRQHPVRGTYVENLTSVPVRSYAECAELLRRGNVFRAQGVTAMNVHSSRSHAIFQLSLVRRVPLSAGPVRGGRGPLVERSVSQLSLVDLAGSERADKTPTTRPDEKHMTECNHINVSLSTLRRVIEALVKRGTGGTTQVITVPYRESLLTHVLANNLGGNSRTVMCATVSPSALNIAETESTLRYAAIARGVQNRVRLPESHAPAQLIRSLETRLRALQSELAHCASPQRLLQLGIAPSHGKSSEKNERKPRRASPRQARPIQSPPQYSEDEEWRYEAERQRRRAEQLEQTLQALMASESRRHHNTAREQTTSTSSSSPPLQQQQQSPSNPVRVTSHGLVHLPPLVPCSGGSGSSAGGASSADGAKPLPGLLPPPRLDRVTPLSLLSSTGLSSQGKRLLTSSSTRLSPLETFYTAIVQLDTGGMAVQSPCAADTQPVQAPSRDVSQRGVQTKYSNNSKEAGRRGTGLAEWASTAVLVSGDEYGELERSDELSNLASRSASIVHVQAIALHTSSDVDDESDISEHDPTPLRLRHHSVTLLREGSQRRRHDSHVLRQQQRQHRHMSVVLDAVTEGSNTMIDV